MSRWSCLSDTAPGKNLCSHHSMGNKGSQKAGQWEVVEVDGTSGKDVYADNNEIRSSWSTKKARICMKKTSIPVDPHDEETHGICHVMVSKGEACHSVTTRGYKWKLEMTWLCVSIARSVSGKSIRTIIVSPGPDRRRRLRGNALHERPV